MLLQDGPLHCPLTQDVIRCPVCVQGVYMELETLLSFLEHERIEGRPPKHPCTRQMISTQDLIAIHEICLQEDGARIVLAEKGLGTASDFIQYYMPGDAANGWRRRPCAMSCRIACLLCVCDVGLVGMCAVMWLLLATILFCGVFLPLIQ